MCPVPNDTPAAASRIDPLLLDAKALARLLSTSAATIWRWDAAGKLPAPFRADWLIASRRSRPLSGSLITVEHCRSMKRPSATEKRKGHALRSALG